MNDAFHLWLIAAVFTAAGTVKGISGMGLPTFSIALLGLVMPPATAATLVLLPSLLTNIVQCTGPHARMLLRRLWPLWLGVVVATVWSPLPDLGHAGPATRIALGGVLIAYGLWGLARPALPDFSRRPWMASGVAGVLSGSLTAATGVFVMPLVPYLQTLRLEKEAFIQALGLSFLVATLALAARLGQIAASTGASVPLTTHALALVAACAGVWIGARLRQRLPLPVFQRALFGVFIALGALMLARAL
ncbi:sulfite exporter TauE/SafE family protein [Hydrogenophaga sp. 2FB]|uniref:sulfite exporter TauE/SafE family protein n=1 Tax=Hydrogenophaga sp. 2FB TaxID=2502187 RepID=UPI0010F47C91|nr:sulfite exporter TauE/SafE family protein [Hydrogenophaga sp. 2FB]